MKFCIIKDSVRIGTFTARADAILALKHTEGLIKEMTLKEELFENQEERTEHAAPPAAQ